MRGLAMDDGTGVTRWTHQGSKFARCDAQADAVQGARFHFANFINPDYVFQLDGLHLCSPSNSQAASSKSILLTPDRFTGNNTISKRALRFHRVQADDSITGKEKQHQQHNVQNVKSGAHGCHLSALLHPAITLVNLFLPGLTDICLKKPPVLIVGSWCRLALEYSISD